MHPTLPYANSKHLSRSKDGPYAGYRYSIFRQVADAAKNVGYRACMRRIIPGTKVLTASARLWDTLDQDGIAQTGSIKPGIRIMGGHRFAYRWR